MYCRSMSYDDGSIATSDEVTIEPMPDGRESSRHDDLNVSQDVMRRSAQLFALSLRGDDFDPRQTVEASDTSGHEATAAGGST